MLHFLKYLVICAFITGYALKLSCLEYGSGFDMVEGILPGPLY